MNTINFTCLKCGETLNCAAADAGREVPCPGCHAPVIIPFPARAPASARAASCAPAASKPRRSWVWLTAVALAGFLGFGVAHVTINMRGAKEARPAAVSHPERGDGGRQSAESRKSGAVKPVAAAVPSSDEGNDSSLASPRSVRILQHRIVDSLPTTGEGEKPIALSGAEKKRGLKFLVVDVALPADEAATYPGTRPVVSDENLAYVRPCLESKAFRYVLNAPSFALQLPGGKSTEGTFIKWPEYSSWCPPRDTVFNLVVGGADACVFHSARSLVIASNRNPATLKATLAFKVPGRAASRGTPTIRYEPPPSDIIAALPVPVVDPATGMAMGAVPARDMSFTPDLDLQKEVDALIARAGMNTLGTENAPVARAVQPRFRQAMPDGPNTVTVVNRCGSWIGLGVFCRKVGNDFQYGSVQGVPAGGSITLVVPNGTFHVYWIRQNRPNSRFRAPNPFTLTRGNDRQRELITLTVGSNDGETPIEEEF